MSPHVQAIGRGVASFIGFASAAVLVIGGEGGVLSVVSTYVVLAAESTVVVGALSLAGVALTAITTLLVARMNTAAKRRGEEAATRAAEAARDREEFRASHLASHLELKHEIGEMRHAVGLVGERVARIEGSLGARIAAMQSNHPPEGHT